MLREHSDKMQRNLSRRNDFMIKLKVIKENQGKGWFNWQEKGKYNIHKPIKRRGKYYQYITFYTTIVNYYRLRFLAQLVRCTTYCTDCSSVGVLLQALIAMNRFSSSTVQTFKRKVQYWLHIEYMIDKMCEIHNAQIELHRTSELVHIESNGFVLATIFRFRIVKTQNLISRLTQNKTKEQTELFPFHSRVESYSVCI